MNTEKKMMRPVTFRFNDADGQYAEVRMAADHDPSGDLTMLYSAVLNVKYNHGFKPVEFEVGEPEEYDMPVFANKGCCCEEEHK